MSTPLQVASISVRFDAVRDRLVLIARGGEGELALQLTRRLSFVLISGLGKLIQQTQADPRVVAAPAVQSELLSMKHANALSDIRQAQADKPAPPVPSSLPSRLLTQIDIAANPKGRTLTMRDSAGPVAAFSLDDRQLHWFVGRLVHHAKAAGWGNAIPVPQWLEQDGSADAADLGSAAHALH